MQPMSLSLNDILKDAHKINIYRGDDSYALTSFLREVESVIGIVESQPDVKQYIYKRIILNKLQGEALHVMRTLGPNANWEETREALINNFGVKESYHQLYQDAFSTRNDGIINYFNCLKNILCKLNEKYEYDREKPVEFSPLNAEKIILKTFLNNIDINLASVIINRNVNSLRDSFNLLNREGLIRNEISKTNFKKTEFNPNHRTFVNSDRFRDYSKNNSINENNINRFNRNSFFRQNNNVDHRSNISNGGHGSSNSRNFINQPKNSVNTNSASNQRNFFQNNNSQNNSGYFRQNNNSQMEIDHIQEVDDSFEQQVNFHIIASTKHFP